MIEAGYNWICQPVVYSTEPAHMRVSFHKKIQEGGKEGPDPLDLRYCGEYKTQPSLRTEFVDICPCKKMPFDLFIFPCKVGFAIIIWYSVLPLCVQWFRPGRTKRKF